ncbi:hypothetical protein BGZ68_008413 [Mortierella alpina]|nr:hypothetical protein BGZ68_008413 [Mortierella alpina]
MPVAPFFLPKSHLSGPDLVFFIQVDGRKAIMPVFVQVMKLHQGSSNFSEKDWGDTLSTVSALKIDDHAKDFRKYCPVNVYSSMIVAYPIKWAEALWGDSSGVQQVVINYLHAEIPHAKVTGKSVALATGGTAGSPQVMYELFADPADFSIHCDTAYAIRDNYTGVENK